MNPEVLQLRERKKDLRRIALDLLTVSLFFHGTQVIYCRGVKLLAFVATPVFSNITSICFVPIAIHKP